MKSAFSLGTNHCDDDHWKIFGVIFYWVEALFFGKVESGWSPGHRVGKQRSRVSSQSTVSSYSFLLSRSTTFTEHSMPWREQTSSAQTVGIPGDCSSQPPSAGGKAGPFMQHWCIQKALICLFSPNDPDVAGWHFHFLQCCRKGLAQKVLLQSLLIEFFIHILFL